MMSQPLELGSRERPAARIFGWPSTHCGRGRQCFEAASRALDRHREEDVDGEDLAEQVQQVQRLVEQEEDFCHEADFARRMGRRSAQRLAGGSCL